MYIKSHNMDKNQYDRYKIIDRILRSTPNGLSLGDLLERVNENLLGYDRIQRRQLQYDLQAMRNLYDAPITKKKGARRIKYEDPSYSIITHEVIASFKKMKNQLEDIEESKPRLQWLQNLVLMLQDTYFTNPMAMEAIDFGDNLEYKNSDRVHEFFSYIINRCVIQVTYNARYSSKQTLIIHPYFLRQYNSRWFLFGWNEDAFRTHRSVSGILNLALDRIEDTQIIHGAYREISLENLRAFKEQYFNDIVGVTHYNTSPVTLVLRFDFNTGDPEKDSASRLNYNYLKTKPFYPYLVFPTDESIEVDGFAEVRTSIIPNKELEAILLRYVDAATIVEPLELRNRVIERAKDILRKQGNL